MRDPLIGSQIHRYQVRELIEKTDLFSLYKSYDTQLERTVLIKIIQNSADYSEEARSFFLAEAKTLARLTHDHIVKILDFGSHNDSLYLVSEYVSGNSLSDLMANPIPWKNAVDILLPITDALIYAHTRGVIHRDLRPDAIFIDLDQQAKLSDFSLVRIIEEEETRDMTTTNLGLGSAGYISPEQGQGLTVDSRSDIYSLGVIFYEMITGKRLFYADTSMEIVIQHIMKNPPRPRKMIPDLPKSVEAIILKAIAKEPEKRYQSMEELASALKSIKEVVARDRKGVSRRVRIMATGLGLPLLVLAVYFMIQANPDKADKPQNATSGPSMAAELATALLRISPSKSPATIHTSSPDAEGMSAPVSFFNLPLLPVLQSSPLPTADAAITSTNAAMIRELARWGRPELKVFSFINEDNTLLASTSAGLYYLDTNDLSAQHFFDTEGVPTTFTVSSDGERVATGDEHGTITIWNSRTGQKEFPSKIKEKRITALELSPDGKTLVFSDSGHEIHLWNPISDESYTFERKHDLEIHSLVFSSDGTQIYSAGYDFQVVVWDVNGHFRKNFTTRQRINRLALSYDDRYLAAAMNDSTIWIWDVTTGDLHKQIQVNALATDFTFLEFLPQSDTFVTGSSDGYIRLWNISSNEPLWALRSTEIRRPVTAFALSKRASQIAVMFADGMLEIWNLSSREMDSAADWSHFPILGLAISPDDRFLAYQLDRTYVEAVSIRNTTRTTRLTGTLPAGNPISSDNRLVIVPKEHAGQLNLYSFPISADNEAMILYNYPVNGVVSFSPDSKVLAAGANQTLTYWALSSGLELRPHTPRIVNRCQAIYGRDNQFVAAASSLGLIFFEENSQFFCQVAKNPRSVSQAILSDGSLIVQALQNQQVEIRQVRFGDQRLQAEISSDSDAESIAISKKGDLLAIGSGSGQIEIYDLGTMRLLSVLKLRTGPIYQILFSNDGKYIIASFSDGTLRFFGIKS